MRTWVYQTLKLSGLWTAVEGRLYQASYMTKIPDNPFHAFYRMGAEAGLLHTEVPVKSTPFTLFVEDIPGDFLRIDSTLEAARVALMTLPPLYPEPRLIRCEWLGTSDDVPEDPKTGTISKLARYRLVHLP